MNAESTSYYYYLTQINKIPLLTRNEEIELATRAKNGDKKAKNALVAANLRFVVQTAKRYSSSGLSMEDLISEGNLGLLRAVESFEPDKGYHFISYAVYWIKQSILKAVSEKSKIIRIPLNLNNSISQVQKSLRSHSNSEISNQSIRAVSADLKLDFKTVVNLLRLSAPHTSLDKEINVNGKKVIYQELISDTAFESPEESVLQSTLKTEIKNVLKKLTSQEREVIELRFGLLDGHPLTLSEVGTLMGLTKERIRQVEKVALDKLRSKNTQQLLLSYVKV